MTIAMDMMNARCNCPLSGDERDKGEVTTAPDVLLSAFPTIDGGKKQEEQMTNCGRGEE